MIKAILNNEKYSNKRFKEWLTETLSDKEYDKVYAVYRAVKEDKKSKIELEISVAEKLLSLIKKEIKKLEKD